MALLVKTLALLSFGKVALPVRVWQTTQAPSEHRTLPSAHVDDIRRILLTHVLGRPSEVSGQDMTDFVLGTSPVRNPDARYDIDLSNLNFHTFQKTMRISEHKLEREQQSTPSNYRRHQPDYHLGFWDAANYTNALLLKYTRDLMLQSIHQTRFNIKKTRRFREIYKNSTMFYMGLEYGMLMMFRSKIRSLYNTMLRQEWYEMKLQLYYYLFIYEKTLAAYIDITTTVKRIFILNRQIDQKLGNDRYKIMHEMGLS